jgi:ribosomal peptide maturation radical SAM protein 1
MTGDSSTTPKVALVSMPWPIFNRPSLQLATLKSTVEEQSTCQVDCFHLYLNIAKAIGIETYARIARSGWAGEALFAPLLFPEMKSRAEKLFRQSLPKKDPAIGDFEKLVDCLEETIAAWLQTTKIHNYNLLGLSVCFFQLLPSLYLASRLKEKHPEVPIVFGGSSCSGKVGVSLFANFPQIDYLIDGEGEALLVHLCRYLVGSAKALPKAILSRGNCHKTAVETPKVTLNDLPYPNYSSYFNEIRKIFPEQLFIPVLPIEFSRGCWWNRCSFCNLNLQWPDYRFKKGERMVAEVIFLAKTHGCLQFAFADNALPPHEADLFFEGISATRMDFDFFAEIRGITDRPRLQKYGQAGLKTVQIGIEALSTTLLTKMAKGTAVIDNIAAMKIASGCSIHLEGNLITEFPGTTAEEIAETLVNLDFVLPFAPLQAATFFLGFNSPMYARPKEFAIKAILPHGKNQKLIPEKILSRMTTISNSYRGDRKRQRKLWKPVVEKLQVWQNFHQKRTGKASHPLHYRDGNTFLLITQELASGTLLRHRLKNLSRDIYLFCQTPQTIPAILAAFPSISLPILVRFIDELHAKRLMFREGDRILSLAIRHPR